MIFKLSDYWAELSEISDKNFTFSGLVVKVCDPRPGETIVDCCAAPGGKALFMAACLKGQGKSTSIQFSNRLYS